MSNTTLVLFQTPVLLTWVQTAEELEQMIQKRLLKVDQLKNSLKLLKVSAPVSKQQAMVLSVWIKAMPQPQTSSCI